MYVIHPTHLNAMTDRETQPYTAEVTGVLTWSMRPGPRIWNRTLRIAWYTEPGNRGSEYVDPRGRQCHKLAPMHGGGCTIANGHPACKQSTQTLRGFVCIATSIPTGTALGAVRSPTQLNARSVLGALACSAAGRAHAPAMNMPATLRSEVTLIVSVLDEQCTPTAAQERNASVNLTANLHCCSDRQTSHMNRLVASASCSGNHVAGTGPLVSSCSLWLAVRSWRLQLSASPAQRHGPHCLPDAPVPPTLRRLARGRDLPVDRHELASAVREFGVAALRTSICDDTGLSHCLGILKRPRTEEIAGHGNVLGSHQAVLSYLDCL